VASSVPSARAPAPWRARVILWFALLAITLIAWAYLFWMPMAPGDFGAVGRRLFSAMSPRVADALLMLAMWIIMMVAMMLPSAAPMIDTYARIVRTRAPASANARIWLFTAGYLLAWTIFSIVATAAQLLLQKTGVINNALTAAPVFGAILLIVAGVYQLSPLKNLCLTGCRSPLGFLTTHWREGGGGALRMGLSHGLFCLGCCWMLMALLFVFGVMNLAWVAALSVFVILEKSLPGGRLLARLSGIAMLAGGLALLI
jgi:predicted metal-binding membrane protein